MPVIDSHRLSFLVLGALSLGVAARLGEGYRSPPQLQEAQGAQLKQRDAGLEADYIIVIYLYLW